jgi:hypothetical protein
VLGLSSSGLAVLILKTLAVTDLRCQTLGTRVALEIDDGSVAKVILKQTDPWVYLQPTPRTWVHAHAYEAGFLGESSRLKGWTPIQPRRSVTAFAVSLKKQAKTGWPVWTPVAQKKMIRAA